MNLSEKFLEAMGIIVDQALTTSDRDYTIEGKILQRVSDVLYRVEISGSPYNATANGVYAENESVLILIPNGNMSGDKVIIGRAGGFGAIAYQDENEILNDEYMLVQTESYVEKNETTISLINNATGSTNLWTAADGDTDILQFKNVADFIKDLTLHNAFYVRCDMTVSAARDNNGYYDSDARYSLNFNFSGNHTYSLSIDDVLGNPFEFSASQSKYFVLPDDVALDEDLTLESITFTHTINKFTTLSIANLEVYSMAAIDGGWAKGVVIEATGDATLNDNSATISTTQTSIELKALTRYLGIHIANSAEEIAKIKYTWQIKNNRVDSDGWITLPDTTSTIELTSASLMCKHNEVRCSVSYNGFMLSDTIEIIDENWPEEDEWISALTKNDAGTEATVTLDSRYTELTPKDQLYIKWYRVSPSGHKLNITSTEIEVLSPVTGQTITLENVLPIDGFNFAYSSIVAELILYDEQTQSTIRIFDKDQLDIDGEFPSIESYVTYYTAQPNGIGRPDQQSDNWLPGYRKDDATNKISFNPTVSDSLVTKDATNYWYTKAELAPWNKTNINLWAVEKLDIEGEDPYWTEPNVISVHPGPNYTIHLSNDNAFIIAESDGTTDDADFGDNTTIEVKLYEDNTVLTDYTGWTITASPVRVSIKQKENEQRIWQVTGFKTDKVNGMTYDDGYVVFTATNAEENKELEARFNISKIYKGANGQGLQGLTLSLDNDNDVLVRHPNGGMISTYPIVTAGIYEGTEEETDDSNIIECYWDIVVEDNKLSDAEKTFSGVTAKFENKKLTISWISSEVTEGRFIFKSGALSKDFKFKVITGTDDYDFAFDQTVFNLSNGGSASCPVKVKKTSPSGVSILTASDGKINLYRDNDPNPIVNWSSVEISNTATFIIKEGDFEWDTETIEVVRDGAPGDNGVDSTWLVANPSEIAVDVNGTYTSNSITFRAVQGNQAYSVGKFKIKVNNVQVGGYFSGSSYITVAWKNDQITIFSNTYSNTAYFPIKTVTCELYTSSGVLLDDEPVLFNYISKSIRESTKLFCHASTEPTAPVLNNSQALIFSGLDSIGQYYQKDSNAPKWYKNTYDNTNTTTPLWCVDYTEYTDGTASLTAVVLVHEEEPVYEIKKLYGVLATSPSATISRLLPWPRATAPQTEITNQQGWSWQSTATYNNIAYRWIWTFNMNTAINQTQLRQKKYVYVSEQATINGEVKAGSWSTPKIYAVDSSVGITVEQAEMYLQAVSQGDGESGVYSLDSGELVINADFIKTGVLTVSASNKTTFSANTQTGMVNLAGWHVEPGLLLTERFQSNNQLKDTYISGLVSLPKGQQLVADNWIFYPDLPTFSDSSETSPVKIFAGWNPSLNNTESPLTGFAMTPPNFAVLEDGTMYSKACKINGGNIGGWRLNDTELYKVGSWFRTEIGIEPLNNQDYWKVSGEATGARLQCINSVGRLQLYKEQRKPLVTEEANFYQYSEMTAEGDTLQIVSADAVNYLNDRHTWCVKLEPLGLSFYAKKIDWLGKNNIITFPTWDKNNYIGGLKLKDQNTAKPYLELDGILLGATSEGITGSVSTAERETLYFRGGVIVGYQKYGSPSQGTDQYGNPLP